MADGLFIPSFRGPGSPGVPGVGAVQRGLQTAETGRLGLQTTRDQTRIQSLIQGARQLKLIRDPRQKLAFLQNRQVELQRSGIDTSDTQEAIQLAQQGRFDELEEVTDQAISLGQPAPDPFTLSPGEKRFGGRGGLIAEAGPTPTPPPTAQELAATAKLRAETGKIEAETKNLAIQSGLAAPDALLAGLSKENKAAGQEAFRLAGGGKDGVKALNEAIKDARLDEQETTKKNVARISSLSQGTKSREASTKKARKFLRAFESGGAQSGTTRTAASFIPGIFTDQGQFDEELDAFAEVAAREKLKAVGEIRPTDADVQGMKKALFGVGRDEETNINLLTEFIAEQEAQDDELGALRASKKAGSLSTFTGLEVEGLTEVTTSQRLVFDPETGQLVPK